MRALCAAMSASLDAMVTAARASDAEMPKAAIAKLEPAYAK